MFKTFKKNILSLNCTYYFVGEDENGHLYSKHLFVPFLRILKKNKVHKKEIYHRLHIKIMQDRVQQVKFFLSPYYQIISKCIDTLKKDTYMMLKKE